MLRHNAVEASYRCSKGLAALKTVSARSGLAHQELLLVGYASIGEAHNFVDRYLSTQSIEDVLTPPVLHEMDVLRTFSNQCSPTAKGDQSIDSPNQI